MTNEDVAQQWVEGLSIIRRHIDMAMDPELWQNDPQKALAATDRINGLKQWCLQVMETMPALKNNFIRDIEERGSCDGGAVHHAFPFAQHQQPQPGIGQEP
ncbi:hypothetical protein [Geopsychrobacter electrodiphilus]|uniref:hypothetical protein n=1 Tax=Geopsychrobacter electrodiphilus TaxID=225196 RepID=UPI0003661BF2|nr:hypothetical protein [Geopsychrobacter electrodiphilus]